MPRKTRVEYEGACYHVINRGNYRWDLFAAKGAAESFERCLGEAAAKFGWRLHAYVIMRNHYHLALETPEPNLSLGMKWLQGTWATRFNRLRGETGRPFQGRFKALHVEPGHALAQVAHYIHLNPVRAKVISAERVAEYASGSLRHFLGRQRPGWLVGETVRAESGGLADTATGWRRYVAYLGVLAEEEPRRRGEKFGRLSRGWLIGSEAFKEELRQRLGPGNASAERFELLGGGAEARRVLRAEAWEAKLRTAARALGIALDALPKQKSAPEKVRLAAQLKSTTDVANGWLADRLDMGEAASVSQYVRRHHLVAAKPTTRGDAAKNRRREPGKHLKK